MYVHHYWYVRLNSLIGKAISEKNTIVRGKRICNDNRNLTENVKIVLVSQFANKENYLYPCLELNCRISPACYLSCEVLPNSVTSPNLCSTKHFYLFASWQFCQIAEKSTRLYCLLIQTFAWLNEVLPIQLRVITHNGV